MNAMLFLFNLLNWGEEAATLKKGLVAAGAAGLGALVVGVIVPLFARVLSGRRVPPRVMLSIRLLTAVTSGWITWLVLSGSGGYGIGGMGGGNGGNGLGPVERSEVSIQDKSTGKTALPRSPSSAMQPGSQLRVEILGDGPIRKTLGTEQFDPERRYRLTVGGDQKLLKLPELKRLIEERQASAAPLQGLQIVLYDNSPDEYLPGVNDLDRWARDEKNLAVDISKRTDNAP